MKKRGAFSIIISLLKLVGSFIGVICLAVVNGTLGFILSMGITVLASVVVIKYRFKYYIIICLLYTY